VSKTECTQDRSDAHTERDKDRDKERDKARDMERFVTIEEMHTHISHESRRGGQA